MKKLFLLLATVGMIFTACDKDDFGDNGNPSEGGVILDPNNPLSNLTCAPNEILYTTKYGLIIELGNTQGFGGNLVYNTYEDGVGRLTFGNDVTTIPENAFKDCNSMEYIKFPETLTLIQKDAFDDCTGLKSLTIPPSITYIELGAFDNCTGELIVQSDLDNIYFPYETGPFAGSRFTKLFVDAKIIYPYTFSGCEYITSVTISDSTQSFAQGAFGYCPNLTTFNSCLASADKRCLLIGDVLLYFAPGGLSEYTIPRDITTLMDDAFLGCSGVAVTIPNNITKISTGDWGAFRHFKGELIMNSKALVEANSSILFGDDSQIELTIGDNITKIGDNRFSGCTSLTSVTIGNSVTSIGSYAFYNCKSLTSVTIPDSVTSIGRSAFHSCSSLTSVYISDLSAWCKISFGDSWANPIYYEAKLYLNGSELTNIIIPSDITEIKYPTFYNYTSLTSVTIPDSVTSIGSYAFYDCWRLTSVTIPNSVTSIGSYAFYDCSSLASVTIPDSVTSIGGYAFSYCTSLRSITIPDSVTSIGNSAFQNCNLLKDVYCKPTTPPSGGSSMFSYNASSRKIYVPRNSVNAYKSASYWSGYKLYIEGYDF